MSAMLKRKLARKEAKEAQQNAKIDAKDAFLNKVADKVRSIRWTRDFDRALSDEDGYGTLEGAPMMRTLHDDTPSLYKIVNERWTGVYYVRCEGELIYTGKSADEAAKSIVAHMGG